MVEPGEGEGELISSHESERVLNSIVDGKATPKCLSNDLVSIQKTGAITKSQVKQNVGLTPIATSNAS